MTADARKRAFARIPVDWERNDTPPEHFRICRERTEAIVRGFLVRAAYGQPLDVYAIAESCYAQAVEDMVARELIKGEEKPWLVPNG